MRRVPSRRKKTIPRGRSGSRPKATAPKPSRPATARAWNGGRKRSALELHNETREHHGLGPLCADPRLTRAARSHSRDMIEKGYFSHASPSGETFAARLDRSGYEYRMAGENLAWGTGTQATPEGTFERWMESPGHRRNVLVGGFREVGVGAATGEYEVGGVHAATMYTVDFGTPRR